MQRIMVHVGHEGLDRFMPPCRQKQYVLYASVYYHCLGGDPLYPTFYRLRGRVYMEDLVSTIVHDSESISTCPIYKI
jgi:hypothetical protein